MRFKVRELQAKLDSTATQILTRVHSSFDGISEEHARALDTFQMEVMNKFERKALIDHGG